MGLLAGFAAFNAIGAISTSTALAIGGAAVAGSVIANTELGWMGEQQQSTPQMQYVSDKTTDQTQEMLDAPELGSDTSNAKKVRKTDLVVPITQDQTGVSVGGSNVFTPEAGTGVNI